jgi:hypothetical protein
MIIGINGKIGAGKDTVGTIIQGLLLTNKNQSSEIKKFAGKLKQIASILTGIPVENFEDQEFKKNLLGPEWGTVKDIPLNAISPFADMQFNVMMTVREFLQKLGTEAMRDGLHTNVWVNALFADYTKRIIYYPLTEEQIEYNNKQTGPIPSVNEKLDYPNWIITDMRFPNELEAVIKNGGITIRVVRPAFMIDGKAIVKDLHPSETALDNTTFDYEIINDGTMEELVKKVREILVLEELI